jgi:hypothetical protein
MEGLDEIPIPGGLTSFVVERARKDSEHGWMTVFVAGQGMSIEGVDMPGVSAIRINGGLTHEAVIVSIAERSSALVHLAAHLATTYSNERLRLAGWAVSEEEVYE